jgi:hypothetical protein
LVAGRDGAPTQITGATPDDTTTKCTVSTFLNLKELADFDSAVPASNRQSEESPQLPMPSSEQPQGNSRPGPVAAESVGLNIAYTINLNLPETTDPDVFNAIFRALKDNLLW